MRRKSKKYISNNLIALIIVLVTLSSLFVDYLAYQRAKHRVLGEVVSSGTIDLCLNRKPSLASNCQSTATVGTAYNCDIDNEENQTLTASDNTSLFDVPSNGKISFTPTSNQTGSHTIEMNVSDNSGCSNSNNTLLLNLAISEAAGSGGGGGAGGGGGGAGGGGGGGGGAPEPTNEAAFFQRRFDYVAGGATLTIDNANKDIPIYKVVIEVKNNLFDVDFKASTLKGNPTIFEPSLKVYKFLGVKTANMKASDASRTTIYFKVRKDWLLAAKVSENSILLFRFDSKWDSLPTKLVLSDAQYAYYESQTNGFGNFAIGLNEPPSADFATDKDIIKIPLKQTETKTVSFKVKNLANAKIDVSLGTDSGKYVSIKDKSISIGLGEEKEISFDVKVDDEPNVYTAKIFLASSTSKKEIKLILEVQPIVSLFDVKVLVANQFKQVQKGSIVAANIGLINIGEPAKATLFYSVRDLNNAEITSNEETLYVKEPVLITRELGLPEDISVGKYIFYVSLISGSNKAFATDVFEVVKVSFVQAPLQFQFNFVWLIAIVLALLLIITIYNLVVYMKKAKRLILVSPEKMREISLEKAKIQKKLDSLMQAYKSRFISGKAYEKGKRKLQKMINDLNSRISK